MLRRAQARLQEAWLRVLRLTRRVLWWAGALLLPRPAPLSASSEQQQQQAQQQAQHQAQQ
jgi:hypothetical protein